MDQFSGYYQSNYAQSDSFRLDYSTPYGGNDSVSTELHREQNQGLLQNLSVETSLEQQPVSTRFVDWNDTFNLPHHIVDPQAQQHLAANRIDISDIQNVARDANEAPWSAFHGAYLQNDTGLFYPPNNAYRSYTIIGASISPGMPRSSFGDARELSTISPDSGFGSARPAGLGGPYFIEQNFVPETLDQSQAGWAVPPPRPTSVKSAPQIKSRPPKLPPPPPCSQPGCGKTFKNHSESKKHRLKHTKPYICHEPECTRQRGFGTQNDLQRHRKAVHGEEPTVGSKTGYICRACIADNLAGASKWWPRLDNFTAHVRRKHPHWNLNFVIERSEAPRPLDAPSESGYASQAAPSLIPQNENYQDERLPPHPVDAVVSRRASQVSAMGLFDQFDPLAGVGEGTATDHFPRGYQPIAAHIPESDHGSVPNSLSMLSDAAFHVASPVALTAGGSMNGGFSSITETNVPSIGQHNDSCKQSRWDDSASQQAGPSGATRHRGSSSSQDDLSMYRTENGDYRCPAPGCDKFKARECDLRKHLKRHSRPYGCTFPDCYKKFGSRNDWKRHENSQHKLNNMWRCEMKDENGKLCCRVYSQEHDFLTHLQRKHNLNPNSPDFTQRLKSMHLGREGYNRFWCGFCNSLINPADDNKQPHDGIQRSAWATRHRHIGDHLDQDSHIDRWICIQYNKPKGILTKEEKKRQKSRFKSGLGNDGDESDLPDDGIPVSFAASKRCADFEAVGDGGDGGDEGRFKMRKLDYGDFDLDAEGESDRGF